MRTPGRLRRRNGIASPQHWVRIPDFSSQQTRGIGSVLLWCWAGVAEGGPTLGQHRLDVSRLMVYLLFSCLSYNGSRSTFGQCSFIFDPFRVVYIPAYFMTSEPCHSLFAGLELGQNWQLWPSSEPVEDERRGPFAQDWVSCWVILPRWHDTDWQQWLFYLFR